LAESSEQGRIFFSFIVRKVKQKRVARKRLLRRFTVGIKEKKAMKTSGWLLVACVALAACEETNETVLTGNEVTYDLQSGGVYNISGTVTLKERKDGSSSVVVNVTGTEGIATHPVHLHLGYISESGADVAAQLSPLSAQTGRSETVLTQLADETPITYGELKDLVANIKIHLSETGPGRDIVLAGGNIGKAVAAPATGRLRDELGVCKSE
jgi:hypothetical protein